MKPSLDLEYKHFIQLQPASGALPGLQITPAFPGEGPEPALLGKTNGDLQFVQHDDASTLWVSLGRPEKAVADSFRQAGGAVGKWLRAHPAGRAWVDLDNTIFSRQPQAGQAFLEGILLGSYAFQRYKKDEDPAQPLVLQLRAANQSQAAALAQHVEIVCQSVLLDREWAHEPANVINPVTLAELAVRVAEKYGLRCTVLDENELARIGAGAILGVGQGSQTPPRLIIVEYPGQPAKAAEKPLLLVGKALTFDSGGYSLKDTNNIQGMKYDKCGGVTVLATLIAAARLGLEHPLVGVIGAAENMVSEKAYRPDDILTTLSGKTVEIVSTDAEGRLVLADSLTYAQQHFQPKGIIDLATLTGGVVVALGHVRAGLMSNSLAFTDQLLAAGERSAERLWPLPLDDEYLLATTGDDADLKNSGGREGHAILGGIFLKQFVNDAIPWAHLDIAGTADNTKDQPYCPKGASGFGVRLLLDYLGQLSA